MLLLQILTTSATLIVGLIIWIMRSRKEQKHDRCHINALHILSVADIILLIISVELSAVLIYDKTQLINFNSHNAEHIILSFFLPTILIAVAITAADLLVMINAIKGLCFALRSKGVSYTINIPPSVPYKTIINQEDKT